MNEPIVCHACEQAIVDPRETDFYQDIKGEWRWRSVADNGEIYATSHEGFETESGAKRNWLRATGARRY